MVPFNEKQQIGSYIKMMKFKNDQAEIVFERDTIQ